MREAVFQYNAEMITAIHLWQIFPC